MTHNFTKPGFYRMRNGQKAEMIAVRNGQLIGVFLNGAATSWKIDGGCPWGPQPIYDLIAPWQDEPQDSRIDRALESLRHLVKEYDYIKPHALNEIIGILEGKK